ncbi:MAG: hypothetical protein WBC91_01125 [Phototrophicaceae bacterium]
MASQLITNDTRNQLSKLISEWGARWRLRRVVLYLPRIVIVTGVVGIIVSLLIAFTRTLSTVPMLIMTAIAMGTTFAIITSALGLWSKRGYEAARQFEALFGLQERISTAFEILDGRIQTSPAIAQRQLEDAYQVAQTVDPRKQIPLKVKWLEWLIALFVIIGLIVALVGSAYITSRLSTGTNTQTRAAITDAANATRDITEDLATDSGLTDEERSALLESAESTLDELNNPDASAEESFVAMSDFESDLREQTEALQEEIANSNSGLESASEALGNQAQQPSENPGETLSQDLAEQGQGLDDLSEADRQQLAQDLQDAADEVREENEDLADTLEEAANALQNNDAQQAQSALEQASQQAQSASDRNQARSETAESLEQAAQQAQQAASEISESEQQESESGDSQEGEQSEQNGDPQEGQEGEESEQGAEGGQQGQQQGQGEDPNAQQASEDGAQVESEEAGSDASQQSGGQEGESETESENNQSAEGQESGEGGGAGNNSGTQSSQDISSTGQLQQQNSTDNDGGEREFDSVFSPELANIQGGDTTIELDTDASNDQTVEGDFQENPTGESTVPYNQVFSSYADAASSALESSYVPLGVRDVVRDYFTSLEPTGTQRDE